MPISSVDHRSHKLQLPVHTANYLNEWSKSIFCFFSVAKGSSIQRSAVFYGSSQPFPYSLIIVLHHGPDVCIFLDYRDLTMAAIMLKNWWGGIHKLFNWTVVFVPVHMYGRVIKLLLKSWCLHYDRCRFALSLLTLSDWPTTMVNSKLID